MQPTSRRDILVATGAAALGTLPGAASAAMGPNDKFDLLLRPAGTIVAGVAFGRPYQSPFSVR